LITIKIIKIGKLVICFSWNNKNHHGFIGDRARKFMVEESAIDSEKEYYNMDLK